MKRRAFLKGAGILAIAVVGGGVWRAYDQGVFSIGQGPAYLPWKDWRNASGSPLALVRAAILAASPHNTQPWLFKVSDSAIELHIDPSRNVGALDPYLREEHIGMGCALENLLLAAPANGYAATATLLPGKLGTVPIDAILIDPRPQLIARVDLMAANIEPSDLYHAIPNRHTNRAAFDPNKPLPSSFIEALGHFPGDADVKLFLFTAEADRKKIVAISTAANSEIYSDPAVRQASDRWIRLSWSEVQKRRDGLTIDAFGLPPLADAAAKMMTPAMLAWAASKGEKKGYSNLMLSAPLIGFIAVNDRYDREQCLKAGPGVATRPFAGNQPGHRWTPL